MGGRRAVPGRKGAWPTSRGCQCIKPLGEIIQITEDIQDVFYIFIFNNNLGASHLSLDRFGTLPFRLDTMNQTNGD